MISSAWVMPGFEYANRAIAFGREGIQRLDGWWRLLAALDPWFSLGLFLVCAMLMVYRLDALERQGLEGTALGTLVMPYASGFPNLMFAYSLGRQGGSGALVVENCIVNNVTNLTLLIGLFALFGTIQVPERTNMGIMIIIGAGLLHMFFIGVMGRLPRMVGAALTIIYAVFLYTGWVA